MSEIADKVQAIIVEKLGVDVADIADDASFTNDLGADSLDTVELVMALEEEFETEIPDEEAEKITSVQQAIDYIKAHYYASHTHVNPTGVIPRGPDLDYSTSHGREHIGKVAA